jgi:hypothetical protein
MRRRGRDERGSVQCTVYPTTVRQAARDTHSYS